MQVKVNVQEGDAALPFHISFLPHNHAHFIKENETVISLKLQHKYLYKHTQYWGGFNGWKHSWFYFGEVNIISVLLFSNI